MSERIPSQPVPFETEIVRIQKLYTLEYEGRQYFMNYDNTRMYTYPEQYRAFNYIYHEFDEGPNRRCLVLFESGEYMKTLFDLGYPHSIEPYPTESVEEAFYKVENEHLAQELNDL